MSEKEFKKSNNRLKKSIRNLIEPEQNGDRKKFEIGFLKIKVLRGPWWDDGRPVVVDRPWVSFFKNLNILDELSKTVNRNAERQTVPREGPKALPIDS